MRPRRRAARSTCPPLGDSQEDRLLEVRLGCPDITRACDLARTFADLVRDRHGNLLTRWIRQAEQDSPEPIQSFAGFLRHDLDAVTAGLTLSWGSGVVKGHVNRIKTLKRAMYGRASFELLRTRILTTHDLAIHGTAMAESEREYIREKSLEGPASARDRGRHGGRPKVFDDDMAHYARTLRTSGVPVPEIAARLFIPTGKNKGQNPSAASVCRVLAEDEPET